MIDQHQILRVIYLAIDEYNESIPPYNTVVGILEGLGFELILGDDRERSYAFTSLEKRIQARLELGRTDMQGGASDQLIRSVDFLMTRLTDDVVILPGHGRPWTQGEARTWWMETYRA